MSTKILKTQTKLLCLCTNGQNLYIGDFLGNLYLLESPYNILQLVKNVDEPISAIEVYNNTMILGTWKGNLYIGEQKIRIEEGIISAIKIFKDLIFIAVNTSLYVFDEKQEKYKIDTKYKINVLEVYNNTLYCGLDLPFIGLLNLYEGMPIYEMIETCHQSGLTGIDFTNGKMITSSCDKTIMEDSKILYSGPEWVRCMHKDVYGVGMQVVYKNATIYKHTDWVSAVYTLDDKIFSIGLDGVIMIYSLKAHTDVDDEEFEKFMRD